MFFFPTVKDNDLLGKAWATKALIATNIVAFAITLLFGARIIQEFGFVPAYRTPVTWITHMFLHGGFWHILGNMTFLWIFGRHVEDMLGSTAYLAAYIIGGFGALFGHMLFSGGSFVPLVGASGAISAVLGLYMIMAPSRTTNLHLIILFFRVRTFTTNALGAVGAWLSIQFYYIIASSFGFVNSNTAFWAHIGGFVAGIALGFLFIGLGFRDRHLIRTRMHEENLRHQAADAAT